MAAMDKTLIKSLLKNDVNVYCFDAVTSTNSVARDLAKSEKTPFLVLSDSQTAGRGRLGRTFYSPKDTGIYMSLTVGGFTTPQDAIFITSKSAVAVTDAIIKLTGKKPKIKWVNDIYLDGKKVCGILTECVKIKNGFCAIIGIGVNLTTEKFPEEISEIAGALKTDVSREELVSEITDNILEMCKNKDDKSYLKKFKDRSMLTGREITYYENNIPHHAKVLGIDDGFGLVIQTPLGEKVLTSGEITVRLK